MLSDRLDADDDGMVSLAEIEKVLTENKVSDSKDAALFLIEEANARGNRVIKNNLK
jgi:hypothetical protein